MKKPCCIYLPIDQGFEPAEWVLKLYGTADLNEDLDVQEGKYDLFCQELENGKTNVPIFYSYEKVCQFIRDKKKTDYKIPLLQGLLDEGSEPSRIKSSVQYSEESSGWKYTGTLEGLGFSKGGSKKNFLGKKVVTIKKNFLQKSLIKKKVVTIKKRTLKKNIKYY